MREEGISLDDSRYVQSIDESCRRCVRRKWVVKAHRIRDDGTTGIERGEPGDQGGWYQGIREGGTRGSGRVVPGDQGGWYQGIREVGTSESRRVVAGRAVADFYGHQSE